MNSPLPQQMSISSHRQPEAGVSNGQNQAYPARLSHRFRCIVFLVVFLFWGLCTQAFGVYTATISTDGTWKFPKLRTDSNGNFYALYWDSTNSGLRVVKWNGAWDEYTSITPASVGPAITHISYGNDYQANFAFDPGNNLHVLFSAGTSALASSHSLYHGIYNGTSWSFFNEGIYNTIAEDINLFIDEGNQVHAVCHVDDPANGNQALYYNSGKILSTNNRGTDELHDSYVQVDSTGRVIIIYRREDGQNLHHDRYYITDSSDNFYTQTPITALDGITDSKEYRVGNVRIDAGDRIHIAYSNITDNTAHELIGIWNYDVINSIWYWGWTKTDLGSGEAVDIGPDNTVLIKTGESLDHTTFSYSLGGWNFSLNGEISDRYMTASGKTMVVYENSYPAIHNPANIWDMGYALPGDPRDFDGTINAAGGITEPVNIPSTASSAAPVSILDFTIDDGGAGDGFPLRVHDINLQLSGTASGNFSNLRFNLTGCASFSGIAPAGSTVSFIGADITVADSGSATCSLQAYWDTPVTIVDNQTVAISINGYTDLVVDSQSTQMRTPNTTVTTGDMLTAVNASKLVFTTQPVGSVSGSAIAVQPVVVARDVFGNSDVDFTGQVVLSSSAGTLSNFSINAIAGVAAFTNVIHLATADKQSFTLTADEAGSLVVAVSDPATSEVVATKLAFTTQPGGSVSGTPLSTQPVVEAVDANNVTDIDFTETITLSEDSPGALTGATTLAAVAGRAQFSNLVYTATADQQSFILTANDEDRTGTDLPTVASNPVVSDVVATKLLFATQPAGSISGAALTSQPVVEARDANNLLDTGFTEIITLTESSPGSLTNNTASALAGRAMFANLVYSATADHEAFTLTANDQDGIGTNISPVSANSITSDVVATRLVFTTQPAPLTVSSGEQKNFTTDPVVSAQDADGVVDSDFNDTVTLTETGAGSAVFANNSVAAVNGVAAFTGLTINYTSLSPPEIFTLQADDQNDGSNQEGDLPVQNSASLSALPIPHTPPPPDMTDASDSGNSNTDNITNNATPSFTGLVEAGSTVTLYSSANGTVGTGTADASGNWSITASGLNEGVHDMTITAGNEFGTSPPSTPLSIVIDLTAPSSPSVPDLETASDSGISDIDNKTNDITPTFSGTADPGLEIRLVSSVDGVVGTTNATAGGGWSVTAFVLSNAQHSITAASLDTAGNLSAPSSALDVVIDSLPPVLNGMPPDMTVQTKGVNDTSAPVSWTEPTATDAVDGNVVPVQTAGLPNYSDFPLGTITVAYTAGDDQGNSATGSFTVTVIQSKFPWWTFWPAVMKAIHDKNLQP